MRGEACEASRAREPGEGAFGIWTDGTRDESRACLRACLGACLRTCLRGARLSPPAAALDQTHASRPGGGNAEAPSTEHAP